MQAKDIRAVENPITAIFDLAEDVEAHTPKIQRLLRYTVEFVATWLFVEFLLIIFLSAAPLVALLLTPLLFGLLLLRGLVPSVTAQGLLLAAAIVVGVLLVPTFGPGMILGIVLLALVFLGMAILDLVEDARLLFSYHALRYRVIRAVREADPIVYVPQGATVVDRLVTSLAQRSAMVAEMVRAGRVRAPALLTGRSGMAYQFDAILSWPAGMLAPFGVGHAGASVYVKAFDRVPSRADLEALRRASEDVTAALRVPPTRVIALWRSDGATDVPDDTYAFLTSEVVRTAVRGRTHTCSLELVTEMPDGTYDFIPLIVETPPPAQRSAAAPQTA